jgi:aconitate hydratase
MAIYDAAMRFKADGTPLDRDRRQGIWHRFQSRDWAAKGTNLLGVRAVITESFERIHRSNLVGMGVLPLQFADGIDAPDAGPRRIGELHDRARRGAPPAPGPSTVILTRADGSDRKLRDASAASTPINELDYFLNGGILPYVLRKLAA